MITDVTAPIFVWCIAGDFIALPVGDVSATMTPDGDSGCSHFLLQTHHRLFVPIT